MDYTLQAMHSHQMHHQQPIHFAHPDERHIPPIHHQPYHLIPTGAPFHPMPPPQHQMTLITHLQPPPGSHHLNQQPQIHQPYPMEYMYEQIHHVPPPQPPVQQFEITYVRTPPENMAQNVAPVTSNAETPIVPKLPKLKHNGMVPVNDPYHCSWCERDQKPFSTVYKGNMKVCIYFIFNKRTILLFLILFDNIIIIQFAETSNFLSQLHR